ncbi:hypothetical protein H0W32_02645 [Patescibacteria group bacterium]|nr:hypothetical protein [Patescibacteria group bacterium]
MDHGKSGAQASTAPSASNTSGSEQKAAPQQSPIGAPSSLPQAEFVDGSTMKIQNSINREITVFSAQPMRDITTGETFQFEPMQSKDGVRFYAAFVLIDARTCDLEIHEVDFTTRKSKLVLKEIVQLSDVPSKLPIQSLETKPTPSGSVMAAGKGWKE